MPLCFDWLVSHRGCPGGGEGGGGAVIAGVPDYGSYELDRAKRGDDSWMASGAETHDAKDGWGLREAGLGVGGRACDS